MIPSATELGTFGLLYTVPFFPQVTTDCDHVLIPKALSAFANMKGLSLHFEIAMSETPRRLSLAPRVPLDLTALNSPGDTVGLGPGFSRHLAHRKITKLLLVCWSHDGRSAEMALFAARRPLWI